MSQTLSMGLYTKVPENAAEVLIIDGSFAGRKAKILYDGGCFARVSMPGMIAVLPKEFYTPYPEGGMPLIGERAGAELQAERSMKP